MHENLAQLSSDLSVCDVPVLCLGGKKNNQLIRCGFMRQKTNRDLMGEGYIKIYFTV